MFASWKLCQSSLFAMALGRCYRVVTCKHWFSVPTYKPDDGYLRVDYDVAILIITSFQKCMVALWKCVLELSIDKTHIIVRQAKTFAWITEKLLIKYHDRLILLILTVFMSNWLRVDECTIRSSLNPYLSKEHSALRRKIQIDDECLKHFGRLNEMEFPQKHRHRYPAKHFSSPICAWWIFVCWY